METSLFVYNTLSHKKEIFEPLQAPFVGMYVCGPTMYGDPHIGNARSAITFDLVFRYLKHMNYKVRYVRNITDVGHLENDSDEGEDKVAKKARLEQLEPMELVQYYTIRYHKSMQLLNILPPSIEPRASGHIIEQIQMIQCILDEGLAYVVKGSVYFDVMKYNSSNHYGKLSGRVLEELVSGTGTRELDGQSEKINSCDFALWKNASPEHIMRWPSPWGDGFPGWHIECSAMSRKYLGDTFDIHGGGMDLMFPHHECEIAQSKACNHADPVKYWLHNNMLTVNGQKMSKSLGNHITLEDFFSGKHPLLEQAYSPMTMRFFFMQAHYRSTIDFSNEALKAAEKGLKKLMNSKELVGKLAVSASSTSNIPALKEACYAAMNDDFNSAILIAQLFEASRIVNSVHAGNETISAADLLIIKEIFETLLVDVLGLQPESVGNDTDVENLMQLILDLRAEGKAKKDYALSDKIRDALSLINFKIKDEKDGTAWTREN
jgi:cysteinyl-tRNA synthetase